MTNNNKKENILLNLVFNIAIPVYVMTNLNSANRLGPFYSLIVALIFPIVYGIYDFISRKNINFISMIGFVSVLLTGTFGLFQLDANWFAIKEASVPLLIGLFILFTVNSSYPLVKKLLYNDQFLNISTIESRLNEYNKVDEFNILFRKSSYYLSISFFVSSVLNFALAKIILTSDPGTEAFTKEIGEMTGLSFPVIALPSTIIMVVVLMYLINSLKKLTNLTLEELLNTKK